MQLFSIQYHSTLSDYFLSKLLYLDEPACQKPNIRKLMEQPWQQTKAQLWDDVTDTLCNLDFIQANAVAKKTYNLVKDFNDVLELIPDNAENILREKDRQKRIEKYTHDLIACARGEKTRYEMEVPESITPWSSEKIRDEIERMKTNPTRLDRLKDFNNYLGQEAGNLQNYADITMHFAYQQAWNYADSGPVGKVSEKLNHLTLSKLFLRPSSSRQKWNPLPDVIKTLSGHSDSV